MSIIKNFKLQTRYFWIILFLIIQNVLSAQHTDADSSSIKKIDSLIVLSDNNWNPNGPYDRNIKWLRQAEKISSETENWEKQVYCLLVLATVYNYKKDSYYFDEVVYDSYRIASERIKENHIYFLHIYGHLSDIRRKKRAYRKSIEILEKGIKACSECSFYFSTLYYIKIASNYISLGDYSKAKQYLDNAISLEYTETQNDFFQRFHTHSIYADLYKKTETFDLAIKHLRLSEEYLTTFFRKDYLNEQVNLWFDFIEIYLSQEKYPEVNKYLKKIENSKFLNDALTNGKYNVLLAKFKYSIENEITDEFLGLIDYGNQFLEEAKSVDVSLDLTISENLEYKGDIYFKHKLYSDALQSFDQALDKLGYTKVIHNASKVDNKAIVLRLLSKKIEIHLIEKNLDLAVRTESTILNLIRHLRIENSSASTIDFWANENLNVIQQILEYNYKENNYSKVYALIEENKSNILVQDITESESYGYANIIEVKIEEGVQLKSELANCRKRIFEAKQSDNIDSIELNTWVNEESRLQIDLDSYLRKLEADYPEYYKLKYNLKEYGVKNAQEQLDNQSILVEYFIGNERGYLAYLSEDNIEITEIENIESLQELTLEYYLNLSDKNNIEIDDISNQLFHQLGLDKLKDFNPEAKYLIIVGDGFLNNVPFETLSNDDGKLLLDNYNIQYQYSARLWQMMKSRKTGKKAYDLVGYAFDNKEEIFADNRSCFDLENAINLKCAEKEVRSAVEILGSKKSLIAGQNISELFSLANETKILHLATHACLDDTDSEYSRIYFNDTLLTNQDLKLIDFSADLVVLSACETGFGEVIKGEGSMSLSKGFFHAGAKSTLVSLWPVDDCATSDLMAYFYKNLKEGQSKDKALRNAKISYRQYANPEKTHPYYWAGFIVIGDCSPIWGDDISLWYMLSVPFAIILILLLLKIYKSRKNLA